MARHGNEAWCISLVVHLGHQTLINTGFLFKPTSFFQFGGEGGIRTLGALLELGALAKLCFRPLSHLTIEAQEPKYSGIYGKRQTPNGQRIGALSNN
jgi:hypothetical protein